MKKIFLATPDYAMLKEYFEFPNAIIEELPDFPANIAKTDQCTFLHGSLLVCEINTRNVNEVMVFFQKCAHQSFEHLCIYPEFKDSLRSSLIESGLCDIITSGDPQLAAQCIRAIHLGEKLPFRGYIHILSDTSTFSSMLKKMAKRFRYEVRNVHAIDELIQLSEKETPALFLVDMDTTGFDSIEFAKKASIKTSMKKAPLILYKGMRDGLFVHDFNPVLQRLAKVIFSREELVNLLLTLFFLSEIASPANTFAIFLQRTDLLGGKRFKEILFTAGPELCYTGNLFSKKCLSELAESGAHIINLTKRIEPLRWMISPLTKRPTCAGGV